MTKRKYHSVSRAARKSFFFSFLSCRGVYGSRAHQYTVVVAEVTAHDLIINYTTRCDESYRGQCVIQKRHVVPT